MTSLPILYSFRRCPYAMRARMALYASETPVRLREVVLRDKPEEMISISPKATVPVLLLSDGAVIDESLAIMYWALERSDPRNWFPLSDTARQLVAKADSEFKHHLDRYKYHTRYDGADPLAHRAGGEEFLTELNQQLAEQGGQLDGVQPTFVDYAIFPFVRQFANHDREYFDALDLPNLQPWLSNHLDSDLFKSVMVKYPPWQTGDEAPLFAVV